ncbi:GNAT family N-acetyltransferase [Ectobacillus ponti]|uniref:Mechanosensitive ion channel protein n=1 Tax=Ectobacillus ponti TaxID=2961894 RepID=A0AA41X3F8_9BACI|nr:mechanosensitive ion channel protein [Ectobacillus ponti]MCP8967937.1 mechanosensitive ion channel protein [Ectobacillus ponti]
MPEIRFARREDVPRLLEFLGQAGPVDERVQRIYPHFMLLEQDGAIQATIGCEQAGSVGLLRSMILSPSVDKGMLLQLLEIYLQQMQERGVTCMYLITTMPDALPLFRLFGFQAADTDEIPPQLAEIPHFQAGMKQPGASLLNCQLSTELPTDS